MTLPLGIVPAEPTERRVYAAAKRFGSLLPPEGGVPRGSVKMRPRLGADIALNSGRSVVVVSVHRGWFCAVLTGLGNYRTVNPEHCPGCLAAAFQFFI